MATSNLHLFPSPVMPRKSSLKKRSKAPATGQGQLKGVAFQFTTESRTPTKIEIQPADDHIKHSLFCEAPSPLQSHPTNNNTPTRSQPRLRLAQRRSMASSSKTIETSSAFASTASPQEDQLSLLPKFNRIAPGPQSPASPGHELFPGSGSPTLVRSNSGATNRSPQSPVYTSPMRSIFPQYNPALPLSHQQYYPPPDSISSTLPAEQINKAGSPTWESASKYEPLQKPAVASQPSDVGSLEMTGLWAAASGASTKALRSIKLGLQRQIAVSSPSKTRSASQTITIGTSANGPLYSAEVVPAKRASKSTEVLVKRCHPTEGVSLPVAQIDLPPSERLEGQEGFEAISMFPHTAALDAVEAVANSAAACDIAKYDPDATSPQAARLAQKAILEAEAKYKCEIVHFADGQALEHPSLGTFPISIKDGKIVVHHASASSSAGLASMDLRHGNFIIDLPSLMRLDTPFLVDTIVCTLLAIVATQPTAGATICAEFEAPPASPTRRRSGVPSLRSPPEKKWYHRSNKASKKSKRSESDLPLVTKGVLGLLGITFKTIIWLLAAGFKVLASLILGISGLASKA